MTNIFSRLIALIIVAGLMVTSCVGDLDTIPIDEDVVTASTVYDDPESYSQVLAKLYAGLAVSGQQGPAGQPDIQGLDEGFGQYLRGFWYHQELTTDEAVIGWNDQTIKDFHGQSWTSEDGFIFAFYSRIFYQIVLCSEFLRETTDAKLSERGVDDQLKQEIQGFRSEARFLRALSYWHALDLFRNVPFITEDDIVGSFFPEQIQDTDLFAYIEAELLEIEGSLPTPRSNDYGRADQAAAWTLLAKLYLNAEVYTGTPRYSEALDFSTRVINSGFDLEESYANLFLADNDNSIETIFPVAFDGVKTRTWGGTTFIIRAGIGGRMDPTASGVASGWGGTRTTRQLVEKFPTQSAVVIPPNEGNTAAYRKLYTPGSHQGWNPGETANSVSSVNADRIYEGYKYFSEDNGGFLITQVPAWVQILGDNDGDGTLEPNGDTIRLGEAGLYRISINLNDMTYTTERTTWGVVGSATAGGWDTDVEMTWNEEMGAMAATLPMNPGQIKFRANGEWTYNLGDDNADAILTQDGAEINITAASEYNIFLFLEKPDYTFQLDLASFDERGIFYTEGQNLDIEDLSLFTEGYAITKFKNVTSTGAQGSDIEHPDTDFPMFRLADVLLMASEALLRTGGDRGQALNYFNRVRERAYGGTEAGFITDAELDLQMILDERARELYWECHRRTDLIRFGQFTGSEYLWQWKGNVMDGATTESYRDVFPIPSPDLGANPNLVQNEGY